jgi:hypothetical protein
MNNIPTYWFTNSNYVRKIPQANTQKFELSQNLSYAKIAVIMPIWILFNPKSSRVTDILTFRKRLRICNYR